jgi:hypothetical protein
MGEVSPKATEGVDWSEFTPPGRFAATLPIEGREGALPLAIEPCWGHHNRTPSDSPLAVSKKCAWAGSMRAKTRSPARST